MILRAGATLARWWRTIRPLIGYILAATSALVCLIDSAHERDLNQVVAWAIALAWIVFCYLEERRADRLNVRWSRDYTRMVLDMRRTARTMYDAGVRDGRREAAGQRHSLGHRMLLHDDPTEGPRP